jgi:putative membrane protein
MSATPRKTEPAETENPLSNAPLPTLLMRAGVGGALMGMANLVPGISGGTMLLAAGVFPQFVEAIADLTRLRFSKRALLFLGTVVFAAIAVIGPLAGLISGLVIHHTWAMYSLFIGLTFGGVPLIWKMAGSKPSAFWIGAVVGLFLMIGIAWLQISGAGAEGGARDGFLLLFVSGILGASAMVLPGISGGYLLLLLGVYVTILNGIEATFHAARTLDIAAGIAPALGIILPVGLGILVGVAGVSNLVKLVLARAPKPTLGLLLGLLLGAVAGLWPFQQGIAPEIGTVLKGQSILEFDGTLLYAETGKEVKPEDFPREFFTPSTSQLAGAAGLIVVGFALTALIAHIGRDRKSPPSSSTPA